MASLVELAPFNTSLNFRFRGKGIEGTAAAGQTTNIDEKFTQEMYINGAQLILKNHVFGDYVNFQVVDVDGIMAPAGTVLDTFGEKWFVASDKQDQQTVILPYPARIYAGLYIRISYKSNGLTDVSVQCNLFRHWKAA
jgi:hypothetical protein